MIRNLLIGLILVVLLGGGASAQGRETKGATNVVPSNYRQQVARRILESTDRKNIRRARISQPQDLWVGLLSGGSRPVVCVEVIRETILTSTARDLWVFTFQDGRI